MKLHLPKKLLTAVITALAAVLPATYGADVISISFGGTTMSSVTATDSTLGGIDKDGNWNIIPATNTNGTTVVNQSNQAAGVLKMENIFGSWGSSVGDTSTVTGVVQRDYIDIKNHDGGNVHTISLAHDYWIADVTYYLSGDAGGTWAPMEINGTQYIGGTNNTLDEGESAAWGTRGGVTTYDDSNSITVTGLIGSTIVGKNVYTSSAARATLGGMQVFDSADTVAYKTTLGAGETAATKAAWTQNGEKADYADIAAGKKYLGISAAEEGSTLILTGGESVDSIAAVANTVTIAADAAINVTSGILYAYEGASLVMNAGLTDGTALQALGQGSIVINSSNTLASLSGSADITIGGNTVVTGAYSGTGALAINQQGTLALHTGDAASAILKATGNGTIEIHEQTIIQGTALATNENADRTKTTFEGNIVVKGGTLIIGDNSNWNGKWGSDLSSLTSIDLDGGSMKLFGSNTDISVVNVKKNAQMNIWEASKVHDKGFAIEELNLEANLSSHATWDSYLSIGKLTGNGNLTFTKARGYEVSIGSIESCGVISNAATMIIGTDASSTINLSHNILNTGSLTINGQIAITGSESNFTLVKAGEIGGLSINGTDGYQTTTGSTFLLIDNSGSGSVTLNSLQATIGGKATTLSQTEEGDVTFIGGTSEDTIYRVNTADITFGGDNATANTGRATSAIVAADRTVTIAGGTDAATVVELLTSTSGEGNITLATNASLVAGDVTQAKGTLTLAEGVTLNLGNNDLNGQTTQEASLSSFNSIVLDGASIIFNSKKDTWNNVRVTSKGASLEVVDIANGADDKIVFAGTTTLDGNLAMINTWGEKIEFENVSGQGNLVIDDNDRTEHVHLTINGAEDFSGKVHIKQTFEKLTLNIAENAGVNVHYEAITGSELNLQSIASGNKVTLQGVAAYLTRDSVINANIELLNTSTKAGLEINDGYSDSTNTFNGKVLGSGNLVINKEGITNVTQKFTGDVSGWTGRLDIAGGTDNKIVFTGNATEINNSMIETRKDTDRTNDVKATVTFDHDKAATINAELKQSANSTFDLVVNNSSAEGATFKKAVTVSTTTLGAGTTASFEDNANLGNLTLGAGATVTATGSLTIGSLTLDLQAYTTDYTAHTLVSTTGELTFTGDLSGYQGVTVGNYTASITNTGSSLVLSFAALVTEPTSLSVTGIDGCADGLLTLTVDADLLNYDFTNNGAIIIPGIESSLMSEIRNLTTLPENGMVGIALMGNDGGTVVATEDGQIGFLGKDGESVYYGENTGAGWAYQANYIPEPATATLSLLALAGLAARRRRKN